MEAFRVFLTAEADGMICLFLFALKCGVQF